MSQTIVNDKLGMSKALFEQARVILSTKDAPAEELAKVELLVKDAKRLQGEAAQLKDIMVQAARVIDDLEKKQPPEEDKGTRGDATKFADWGEYLEAVWRANHKQASFQHVDQRLQWFQEKESKGAGRKDQKVLQEAVGASGGFLVPAEFLPTMQAVMAETAMIRPRATVIRMRRRQIDIPVLDQTGTTSGVPHWFGGMLFYWSEEATEKTETTAAFRKISLVAHKLIGYTYSSDELVQDSAISLGDFLSGPLGFAGGATWMEDYAFIRGTGAGQPLGVINAGATISVARAAQNAVGLVDLLNMLENFLPSGQGRWLYTQSALSELMQINGPAANASYVFMPSAREGAPDTIFGYPAQRTEKCPRIGTAGDFILADWRYYLVGDRQATTIESTQYDRWKYDETSWRLVHRVDGQPWLSAPLTYSDSVTTVSPFVILADKTT